MKQFWTPLAGLFGLVKGSRKAESVPKEMSDGLIGDSASSSNWQAIHDALIKYALEELIPRSKRHAEIVPDDAYIVTRLDFQAGDQFHSRELDDWFNEADATDLTRWIGARVWNSPELRKWIDPCQIEEVKISSPNCKSTNDQSPNPYLGRVDNKRIPSSVGISVISEGRWGKSTAAIPQMIPSPPIHLSIEEDGGSRFLRLTNSVVIVGKEKAIQLADGQRLDLKDGQFFSWQNQIALFLAVEGTHVSGLHLEIQVEGLEVKLKDLASTNGTYVIGRRLIPNQFELVNGNLTLCLGGLPHDRLIDTPRIRFTFQLAVSRSDVGMTQLRSEPTPLIPAALAKLKILCSDGTVLTIPVTREPFMIGRSSGCDYQIPAEHKMVSREHIRILEINSAKSCALVADLSRQSLTRIDGTQSSSKEAQPLWVQFGSTIEIGCSSDYPGFAFQIIS